MALFRLFDHGRPMLRCGTRPLIAGVVGLVIALSMALPTAAGASSAHAFVAQINLTRAEYGIRPLRLASSLQRSSANYSSWMLEEQFFGHLGAIRAPRRFAFRGEVLANTVEEDPDAATIVLEWLASPSHRAVLLDRRFRFVGIGVASGWLGDEPVTLVTGHFGGAVKVRAAR